MLPNNVTVAVRHRLDHIWLNKSSAVCDCRDRSQVLYHTDLEVLTEGGNRKVDGAKCILVPKAASSLTRKVDSGFFKISEISKVIIKGRSADPFGKGHHNGVAGLLKSARKRERSVTVNLVAMDNASVKIERSAAHEGFFEIGNTRFERHCRRYDLKCRTRHISEGQRLVLPHLIEKRCAERGISFITFAESA